jgi:hypothetical protein
MLKIIQRDQCYSLKTSYRCYRIKLDLGLHKGSV